MVAKGLTATRQHSGSVSVIVVDAREKKQGKLLVTPEGLREAVVQAVQRTKIFNSVATRDGAYELRVGIIRLSENTGPNAITGLATRWTLTGAGKAEPLMDEVITKSYSAKFSEGAIGDTRQRAANEGAAREVINEAFMKLSNLSL